MLLFRKNKTFHVYSFCFSQNKLESINQFLVYHKQIFNKLICCQLTKKQCHILKAHFFCTQILYFFKFIISSHYCQTTYFVIYLWNFFVHPFKQLVIFKTIFGQYSKMFFHHWRLISRVRGTDQALHGEKAKKIMEQLNRQLNI